MIELLVAFALIVSYALIGAGIKVLDHVIDNPTKSSFSKSNLWLITIGLAILVNIWVFFDDLTAVFTIGIISGLVATRKVDNYYFIILAMLVLPLSLFRIFGVFYLLLPTLIVVFVAALLDELLHTQALKIQNPSVHWVLLHRPALKIAVLFLLLFGYLTLVHTLAFWMFDLAYDLVAYYFGASQIQNS